MSLAVFVRLFYTKKGNFIHSDCSRLMELHRLMRDTLKGQRLLCERNEVKFNAIAEWAKNHSIVDLCSALRVSSGAYYRWRRKPAKMISKEELLLYREAKRLFNETRSGIIYVRLCRALNKSGFVIGETRTKTIMRKLNLVCSQHKPYKSTTNSHHGNPISPNLLNQKFNPEKINQVWSIDITYLPTRQGWVYLAIVMDLHLRKIVGCAINKRMTTALILRKPPKGMLHHSDRGSQYTSRVYCSQLAAYGMKSSMSGEGNCYDNAVIERFFGSLKYEWLANVIHLTCEGIINDVNQYIRYYNGARLHSTLGYVSPNEYENSRINVCN